MDDGFSEPTRRRMWPLEVVAAVTRPQQGLVALPLALAGEIREQELRYRHGALLVSLKGTDVDPRACLDGILGDGGSASQHCGRRGSGGLQCMLRRSRALAGGAGG